MKKKSEILLSVGFAGVVLGFLSVVWLGKLSPNRTETVAYDDGTVSARSSYFASDGDQDATSRIHYQAKDHTMNSLKERIFSSLGLSVSEAEDENVTSQDDDVRVAHGTAADVPEGYNFETYMKEVKRLEKKEKEAKEKREKKEKEKREKEEVEETEVVSDTQEDESTRAIVSVEIADVVKKPFYSRETYEDLNSQARTILGGNADRGGSFGRIFSEVSGGPFVPLLVTAEDAHQQRMLEELQSLQIWAGTNRIIFSEMGITSDDDDAKYIALANKFFEAANPMGFSLTGWAIGDWWGNYGGSLSNNAQISTTGVSGPFVNNGTTNRYIRGLNLAGGEFGMDPDANGAIGEIDDEYTYHITSGLWQAMKDRGLTHARVPFRLERLFNTDGSFNAADKQLFLQGVAKARSVGMKILLDPHNYGAMQMDGRKEVLGQGRFSSSLYNTMMRNLAQMAIENGDVIDMIGLMNEPKNIDPAAWETLSQSALNAIRSQGFQGVIEVPTGNWQGIQDIPRIHPGGPWITDPGNNFMYGVHQYFDADHSGHYVNSYSQDEATLRERYVPSTVNMWGGDDEYIVTVKCPPSSDTDGDGWGWDGANGCKV